MFEELTIESHRGAYAVRFDDDGLARLGDSANGTRHFLVDPRVGELYREDLERVLESRSVLLIEAKEQNKSLERFPKYVNHLVSRGLRRTHTLVAIGGGIIQDIACFLAATMLRGVAWHFYPSTLLAQADSCIGSKSSINCGSTKNILGTFTPPEEIVIATKLLRTLQEADVRSGIGEMLKVHAIEGPESFVRIASDYESLLTDEGVLRQYVRRSLEIKKRIIEVDEFDRGIRNVMNYGHSFGHAIEAATDFGIPHGIAVTIGMDMANFVAARGGRTSVELFESMHSTLKRNYHGFETHQIPSDAFFAAIDKDKKNVDAELTLILVGTDGRVERVRQRNDAWFRRTCTEYLSEIRTR